MSYQVSIIKTGIPLFTFTKIIVNIVNITSIILAVSNLDAIATAV